MGKNPRKKYIFEFLTLENTRGRFFLPGPRSSWAPKQVKTHKRTSRTIHDTRTYCTCKEALPFLVPGDQIWPKTGTEVKYGQKRVWKWKKRGENRGKISIIHEKQLDFLYVMR